LPPKNQNKRRRRKSGIRIFIKSAGSKHHRENLEQAQRNNDAGSAEIWSRCIKEKASIWLAYSEVGKRPTLQVVWIVLFVYPHELVLQLDAPIKHRLVEPEYESAILSVAAEMVSDAVPVIIDQWPVADYPLGENQPLVRVPHDHRHGRLSLAIQFCPRNPQSIQENRERLQAELVRHATDYVRSTFLTLRVSTELLDEPEQKKPPMLNGPWRVIEETMPN
jgi:hypothetical protein